MNARLLLSDESLALLPDGIEVIGSYGDLYAVMKSGNTVLLSDVLELLGVANIAYQLEQNASANSVGISYFDYLESV